MLFANGSVCGCPLIFLLNILDLRSRGSFHKGDSRLWSNYSNGKVTNQLVYAGVFYTLKGLPREANHGNRIRNNTAQKQASQNEGFIILEKEVMTSGFRTTGHPKKIRGFWR